MGPANPDGPASDAGDTQHVLLRQRDHRCHRRVVPGSTIPANGPDEPNGHGRLDEASRSELGASTGVHPAASDLPTASAAICRAPIAHRVDIRTSMGHPTVRFENASLTTHMYSFRFPAQSSRISIV